MNHVRTSVRRHQLSFFYVLVRNSNEEDQKETKVLCTRNSCAVGGQGWIDDIAYGTRGSLAEDTTKNSQRPVYCARISGHKAV